MFKFIASRHIYSNPKWCFVYVLIVLHVKFVFAAWACHNASNIQNDVLFTFGNSPGMFQNNNNL
jgi:hypothetical protein